MGAALGYLSTLLSLFKTLFDSPQIMISSVVEEHHTKEKSEKSELIRSLSSVFNLSPANGDYMGNDEIKFPDSAGLNLDTPNTPYQSKSRKYNPGSAKILGRGDSMLRAFISSNKLTKKSRPFKIGLKEAD